MASWDVFHADSLELERDLTTDAIRDAMAGGSLRADDLVRPAGTTTAWSRLGDLPELSATAETSTVATPDRPKPREARPTEPPERHPPRPARSPNAGSGAGRLRDRSRPDRRGPDARAAAQNVNGNPGLEGGSAASRTT